MLDNRISLPRIAFEKHHLIVPIYAFFKLNWSGCMSFRNHAYLLSGWEKSSLDEYSQAYKLYGGSVNTHPDIIKFTQDNTPEEFSFLSKRIRNELISSVFFCSKNIFCSLGEFNKLTSETEVIFPVKKGVKLLIPFKSKNISPTHSNCIINKLPAIFNKRDICIVRDDFSKKTIKNRRNELNRFLKAGGEITPVSNLTPNEICSIYRKLFAIRWGNNLPCNYLLMLEGFIKKHHDMLFGNVLTIAGEACAYDLIIKSESLNQVYYDVVNGGFDLKY
ncbi:hypothetical protein ACKUTS_28295, partial [Serratia marcescens]